jgi:hypothetical protein|tara:strand:+ start:41 stop:553 length:513 start_codon:yes stop_codon:yes gene_type:complete
MNTNNDVYNVYFKDAFGKTITDGIAIMNDPKLDEFRGKAVTNTDDINLADVSAFLDITGLQYAECIFGAISELLDFLRFEDDELYAFVNNVYEIESNIEAISCQAELNSEYPEEFVDVGDAYTDEVSSLSALCAQIDPDKWAQAVESAESYEPQKLITEDNSNENNEGCS